MLNAGTEGFSCGFFSGKTGGKTFGGGGSGAAIGYFRVSKHAAEKAVAEALHGAKNAGHFDEVDSGTDDHEATVAQGKNL